LCRRVRRSALAPPRLPAPAERLKRRTAQPSQRPRLHRRRPPGLGTCTSLSLTNVPLERAVKPCWQWILNDIGGVHSVVRRSHSSSAHCSSSQTSALASRCIALLGNEGSRSMLRRPSFAYARPRGGRSIAYCCTGRSRCRVGDGTRGTTGYPAPGWVPPVGWAPPPDWAPPAGWYPPPGWAPPPTWVGPCAGPLFDLFHPLRCA
jgi:hypothetical protein